MMRKTLLPLLALPAMALAACGNNKIYGTYAFQMGRDKGVHARAELHLGSGKVYNQEKESEYLGESFRLRMDVQTSDTPKSSSSESSSEPDISSQATSQASEPEASSETSGDSLVSSATTSDAQSVSWSSVPGSDIETILEIAYTLLGDGTAILGYYYVGEASPEGGNILHFGLLVPDGLAEIIASALGLESDDFSITPKMTELVVYSTIEGKAVNLSIPVSMNDLILQFYWYGYDFHTEDSFFHFDYMPDKVHPVGTHPTADDVALINADANYKAHHPTLVFRDYFTVTLSLIKQ